MVPSPYAALVGQRLIAMRVFEPWKGRQAGHGEHMTPAIFGAVALSFERDALICTSPLRYQEAQQGTVLGNGAAQPIALGYRVTLCHRDGVEVLLPVTFGLADGASRWEAWGDSALLGASRTVEGLVIAAEAESDAGLNGALDVSFCCGQVMRLSYRPDLDGAIEWAQHGQHFHTGSVVVLEVTGDFGWLHPAAPHSFILDDQVWRSAQLADWPFVLRKLLRRHAEPKAFYRHTIKRALLARFRQRPLLRQRLLALRYPVQVKDVPDGVVQEIAEALRQEFSQSHSGLTR